MSTQQQYPYVVGEKHVDLVFDRLRLFLPKEVDVKYVGQIIRTKSNTMNVIRLLHFLDIVDSHGGITQSGHVFKLSDEKAVKEGVTDLVKVSYRSLFMLTQGNPWSLDFGSYVSFFRSRKGASDLKSSYQALTFQALGRWVGRRDDEAVVYPFTVFLGSDKVF